MVINPIGQSESPLAGKLRVSARVHMARRREEIWWFDVPAETAPWLAHDASSWALLALPLAARLNEELCVDGAVDPQLKRNLESLLTKWCAWHPQLHKATLICTALSHKPACEEQTALLFTGGVDSFYSLLHYSGLPRISHLVYVEGYDIPLENEGSLTAKRLTLQRVASARGLRLTLVRTNLRRTSFRNLDWGTLAHGPALGAVGLMFGGGFSKMLLSSSYGPQNLCTWGSHPELDPLMSTARTEFVHYGSGLDRFEKTRFVAQFPEALENLHVCWRESTHHNCGTCEKCFRTQLALAIVGALPRAVTFPLGAFSVERLRRLKVNPGLCEKVYPGLAAHAEACGRAEIAEAIRECIRLNVSRGADGNLWESVRQRASPLVQFLQGRP